eukprot:6208733-Pleurochrysis_carterae.AAC.1
MATLALPLLHPCSALLLTRTLVFANFMKRGKVNATWESDFVILLCKPLVSRYSWPKCTPLARFKIYFKGGNAQHLTWVSSTVRT